MSLTIRKSLSFGGLVGAEVVAGETGLDTPLESISVLEVAESNISKWVLKNQMYITSFYAIWDNVKQQKEVVQTLIEYGCCGLVLCYVGTWIQQIDPEIVRICDEAGFPLIQAPTDVSYIEIMNPIINLLYEENTQTTTKEDYSMIRNDFLNLIVNEEDTNVVLRQMNQKLDKKISYYDTYGKIIFSDEEPNVVQIEEKYLRKDFNHVLYACSTKGYAVMEIQGTQKLVGLIRSQKNLFGLFITNYEGEEFPGLEEQFINPLVLSGALLLRKRNRSADLREKAVQEYVTDLIVWNFPADEKALERGQELGLSILDKNCMVLININSIQQMKKTKVQLEMQNYVKRVLLARIETYIKMQDATNWLVLRSDTIILFLNTQNQKTDMEQFCNHLLKMFVGKMNLSISIGISNSFNSAKDLPNAYYQAFHAAVIGREHYGENKVVSYESIYFFQKLHQMSKQQESRDVCMAYLRPISQYDEIHGTDLEDTLRCLLENNGNTQVTADQMYVHKNTILQRRGKITELLGHSPFEMPYLLNYLMVYDIMSKNK